MGTSNNSELIQKIRDTIETNYDPDVNGDGYWGTGNFDDTFNMGVEVGEMSQLYAVAQILGMNIPPMKEMTFDY